MNLSLSERAIQSALDQNWDQAIQLNLEILVHSDNDVAALNRLSYAYLKTGKIPSAKVTYEKVLKIDKYNPIALKNLKWLSNVNQKDINHRVSTVSSSPNIFLEEPGKTRLVTLVNPAAPKILCNIMTAQKLEIITKKHSIDIRTESGVYIGALPDDLSHRLLRFIEAGSIFNVYIKNVTKSMVSVFLREIKRSKKYADLPAFPI